MRKIKQQTEKTRFTLQLITGNTIFSTQLHKIRQLTKKDTYSTELTPDII